MPRPNTPWFRKSKNAWYVTLDGRQIALGVHGRGSRKAAIAAYARLITENDNPAPCPAPPSRPESLRCHTVQSLVAAFLADAEARVSLGCLRNYRLFLKPFASTYLHRGVETLTSAEVEAYSRQPGWSATYRSQFLGCVTTLMRWGLRQRLLATNPVPWLNRPPKASRGTSAVITEREYKKLIAVAGPDDRDLLTILWHSGARPGEIASLTAEQILQARDGVVPLAEHKTAHKGKARLLVLTGIAWTIVERRAGVVQTGLLFRGRNGRLTAQAIGRRLSRLCTRAEVRPVIAYGFRHGWATDALLKGLSETVVAALLGHSSPEMVRRHYSHVSEQAAALKAAARRVR